MQVKNIKSDLIIDLSPNLKITLLIDTKENPYFREEQEFVDGIPVGVMGSLKMEEMKYHEEVFVFDIFTPLGAGSLQKIMTDRVYEYLKRFGKNLDYKEVSEDPYTCGLFTKKTFERIVYGVCSDEIVSFDAEIELEIQGKDVVAKFSKDMWFEIYEDGILLAEKADKDSLEFSMFVLDNPMDSFKETVEVVEKRYWYLSSNTEDGDKKRCLFF